MKKWVANPEVFAEGIPFDQYYCRKYDENKQFTESDPSKWTDIGNTLSGFAKGTGYIRYVFRNSDDSDIAPSDIAGSITVKYGNFNTTYNLTASET